MNCRRLQGSIYRVAKTLVVAVIALSLLPLLPAKTKQDDIQWMTSEEAFETSHNGSVPGPEAIKKVVIDASYEEVFHAASNAVTQSMWEIDKQDKTAGVLLAHRIVEEPITKNYKFEDNRCTAPAWVSLCTPEKHLYFYRVKMNELNAKQTEVVIEGKVQGYCILACTPVNLFGAKLGKTWCSDYKESCGELRTGAWLKVNDQQEMSQFVALLRNNLIAAGGL
jgi:hypothetical protein